MSNGGLRPIARLGQLAATLRVDGKILVGFLVASVLLFIFVKLASEVVEGDTMGLDRLLMRALRDPSDPSLPVGPAWLGAAMVDFTALGGVAVLTVLTAVVAGYLAITRKAATAVFVIVAIACGAIASTLLKSIFDRPRPDLVAHLVMVDTTSFPSGHAMNSAVVYLTLGALLSRTHSERATRAYILAAAVALTLTIGFSRVFLGVHWPSDVLAGWIVGAFWAALCSLAAKLLQQHGALDLATTIGEASAIAGVRRKSKGIAALTVEPSIDAGAAGSALPGQAHPDAEDHR